MYIHNYVFIIIHVCNLSLHAYIRFRLYIGLDLHYAWNSPAHSGRQASAGARGCSMVFGPKHQATLQLEPETPLVMWV